MTEADRPVEALLGLLRSQGSQAYLGEPVTQVAHALQAAELAAREGASDELVAAALLHDLGWLIGPGDHGADHAARGADLVARWLPAAVSEPIRLHVEAKRWLCATDPGYHAGLSDASRATLVRQGGPMGADEAKAWLAEPGAEAAVALRRWDDRAKVPGLVVADLTRWEPLVRQLAGRG